MTIESLDQAITRQGNPVELLRNADFRAFTFPVAPEFSNWRSEQRAWRRSAALLDQSHHMTDLFLRGEGLIELLSSISVNSYRNFRPGVAKQMISVNEQGYVIGDGILFHLGDGVDLVGHHVLADWVKYQVEKSGLEIEVTEDPNSAVRDGDPVFYRYELQGPRAYDIIEKLTGEQVPQVKFFHVHEFTFAGTSVRGLRHGMAGEPGFEFFGPFSEGARIREAILDAGEEFGILPVGSKAYSSASIESGWVPTPLPAIFGDDLRDYRTWLPASRVGSLGGSLRSADVQDYYLTPYDLGYGRSVNFDHEFIGKQALQDMASSPARQKVTLIWNPEDVAEIVTSQLRDGLPAKFLDFPKSRYAFHQFDEVLAGGKRIGVSTDPGYVANDKVYASLACVDQAHAASGSEVELLWGEDPNSDKGSVEEHRQVRVRATVAPAPLHDYARTAYRSNTRL
ncbi:aminomethyltransferase family protein [Nesterenkonia sp. NBAIMH1]|uniref:aminomethyltransferase family protein n=1 Tax=Nesterenkonia sp. NBAIMH1 TaxID=2600320 RepID=UPI0011B7638C|nr:aminomethyltransferase family protein [Nesterenkonia sp. NBAIMH1]